MKRVTILACLAAVALGMNAKPLTPRQALERISSGHQLPASPDLLMEKPSHTQYSVEGVPTVYVFNSSDGNGFRILSADDVASPVLGYSDSGTIDAEAIDPIFKSWLEELSAQIASASGNGGNSLTTYTSSYGELAEIPPMVRTHWHQQAPYNGKSPEVRGNDGEMQRCSTGSAAVAMAQLMNYFKYPQVSNGQASYEWTVGWMPEAGVWDKRQLELDLSTLSYDWGAMLDSYGRGTYTDRQADAVATLMQAAGYAVGTQYSSFISGPDLSSCMSISRILRENFGFDGTTRLLRRSQYTSGEWGRMIYDNLKEVGPVVMVKGGGNPWAFICDGYDGDGYFHINWGCGGSYDGYYLMEALNPFSDGHLIDAVQGTLYGLAAVFGAKPSAGTPYAPAPAYLLTSQNVTISVNNNNNRWLSFQVGYVTNFTDGPVRLGGGVIVEPQGDTPGESMVLPALIQGEMELRLSTGASTRHVGPDWGRAMNKLPDGRYKVTYAVRDLNKEDSPYVPISAGRGGINHGYLNIREGSASVENVAVTPDSRELKVIDVAPLSPLRAGRKCKFRVRLRNDHDEELAKSLYIKLRDPHFKDPVEREYYGYTGLPAVYTVPANTEKDFDIVCEFYGNLYSDRQRLPDTFILLMMEDDRELDWRGSVTYGDSRGKAPLSDGTLKINDCQCVDETVVGETVPVYQVPAERFSATADYKVGSGYFDGVLSFSVYRHNQEVPEVLDPVAVGLYREQQFMDGDTDGTVTGILDFDGCSPDEVYVLAANYTQSTNPWSMDDEGGEVAKVHFRILSSGIGDIIGETGEQPVSYYSLQGIRILNPEKGQTVIRRQGAESRKVIFR